jgi:protein-tyrosine phosphatase
MIQKASPSILFVCMGNICRSPIVETVARVELARAGIAAQIASAGTERYHVGEGADPRQASAARVDARAGTVSYARRLRGPRRSA